jgi:biopolymer transport protein ExbD
MKMSRRAKRMQRSHNRHQTPPLNLVSLMDIFTILVFFLLVSSSNSYQLPATKDLKLPTSKSTNVPEETLVIAITRDEILLSGTRVETIAKALSDESMLIMGLKDQLALIGAGQKDPNGKKITIMSDENVSYAVIRKVLSTCQESNYTRIAFAALQKDLPPG